MSLKRHLKERNLAGGQIRGAWLETVLATHSGLLPPGDQPLGEGLVEALKQIPGMTWPPLILPSSKAEVKPIPQEQGGQSPPVLDTLKLNPGQQMSTVRWL